MEALNVMEIFNLSDSLRDFIAGAVAGAFAITLSQPLDTVRVRLQQQRAGSGGPSSTLAVLKLMLQREGPFSPWKGLTYPLLFASFQSAILFQAYGWTLRQLAPPQQQQQQQQQEREEQQASNRGQGPLPPSPSSTTASWIEASLIPHHPLRQHLIPPQQTRHDSPRLGGAEGAGGSLEPHPHHQLSHPHPHPHPVHHLHLHLHHHHHAYPSSTQHPTHSAQHSAGQQYTHEPHQHNHPQHPQLDPQGRFEALEPRAGEHAGIGQGPDLGASGGRRGTEAALAASRARPMGIPAAEPGASHLQQPHGCEQDGEADGEVEGGGLPTPRDGLIAGTVAGMAQVFLWSPVELLKLRAQLQTAPPGSPGYRNPAQLAVGVLRQDGVAGLYRGFTLTVVRDAPSYAMYFWLYHHITGVLAPGVHPEMAPPATQVLAGGLSGVLAWLPIYPLDVIKTRVQAVAAAEARGRGVAHYAREMLAEGGPRVFFRGMSPTLARAFIMDGASFLGYTATLRALGGGQAGRGRG